MIFMQEEEKCALLMLMFDSSMKCLMISLVFWLKASFFLNICDNWVFINKVMVVLSLFFL